MNINIVGATGVVGRKLLGVLEENNFDFNKIKLFATKKNEGKQIKYKDKYLTVGSEFCENELKNGLFVLCVDKTVSKELVPLLLDNGNYIIDCSTEYRKNPTIPLIAVGVNDNDIKEHKLICNPNCVVLQIVIPIMLIKQKYGINRIDVTSFQSVSGSGKKGIDDLIKKEKNFYRYDINKTCIPLIGDVLENGYSSEEDKIRFELRKILNDKDLIVNATCVRVPVEVCHGISLSIETKKQFNLDDVKSMFINDSNCVYQEVPNGEEGIESDNIFIGRLRKDLDNDKIMHMYIVGNNLRRGAASNAYWIIKKVSEK